MDQDTVATQGSPAGPDELVLIRHGESLGNVANHHALTARAHRLDLDDSDERVALSDKGRKQASALARRISTLPPGETPTVAISSPYRRAHATAELALADAGFEALLDERLRERELGLFDGMTWYGIREMHPDEFARRERVGKFYYRPPGGESWADVVLRVRSVLVELQARFAGERVWLFTHEAVILAFRYVIEGLDAHRVLALQQAEPVANCSLTRYRRGPGGLVLVAREDSSAVEEAGVDVTHEPDAGTDPEPPG